MRKGTAANAKKIWKIKIYSSASGRAAEQHMASVSIDAASTPMGTVEETVLS